MPRPFVLVARGVHVAYGTQEVLRDVDITAAQGRVTALLGPNGAGKTTFIRCCTGLVTPDAGRIEIFGAPPASPIAAARVGVMPQQTGAWGGIAARQLLTYLASLYEHPQPVDELMALLGIDPFATTPYRRLSGGQQQAVNLAGALVGRPGLVFLDEPTAGLDVRAKRTTWDLIRRVRDAGVAVVLTTHDMREAAELSDVVHIIDRGRITLSGTVADLTRDDDLESVFLAHTTGSAP